MDDIKHHKYETPTPIQTQGIPIGLSGRDILGCAETGSGKTASFSIPMIQHCLQQSPLRPGDGPFGLVLAPTRELAQQIEREVAAFSRSSRTVRTCIVVGGTQMHEQRHELHSGVEIVVATPGRFIDHLQQGNTRLDRVSFIVLDEADRMLDMGFEPQIKEVGSVVWLDRVSFVVLDEADRMLDMGFEPQIKEVGSVVWLDRVSFIVLDEADRMLDMGFEPQIKEATPGWTACPSSSWMRLTECWTWDSSRRSKRLDRVSFIVLDEADRMLDMGFEPQIKEVGSVVWLDRVSFIVLDEADRMLDMGFEPQIKEVGSVVWLDRVSFIVLDEADRMLDMGFEPQIKEVGSVVWLDRVSFIVLDEADRMLDMGFEPQIKEATPGWTACPSSSWMRLTECWTWDSSRRSKRLDRVSFIVLDEADRMLDMGFEPQIQEATPGWTACPSSSWMRPTECWTWDSSRRSKRLDRVSFIVLDEADRMLDMGFEPQIKEVGSVVWLDRVSFIVLDEADRMLDMGFEPQIK
eukprot:gene28740-31918_t